MALMHRTPFDIEAPLVARKVVTEGLRSFVPGEVFPWKELGLDHRRVAQMWSAMQLDVAGSPTSALPVRPEGETLQHGDVVLVSLGGGAYRRAAADEIATFARDGATVPPELLGDGALTPPARPSAKQKAAPRGA